MENKQLQTIEKKHLLNYSILLPYLFLSIIGLIVVYSTTSANLITLNANPFASVINQGIYWLVSLVAITFIYRLRLTFLKNSKILLAMLAIETFLLIIARFFTQEINGAHGWISIKGISFQPAEYLKLIMIWYLTFVFSRRQKSIAVYDYQALTKREWFPRQLNDWRLFSLALVGLVAIQPDLGNASIIVLTMVILFAVSGIGYRWFMALIGSIAGLSTLFLGLIGLVGPEKMARVPVFGYVARRFSAFFNPFTDVTGAGHQLANSYYAMSNGGWFGLGLGNSIEKRGYLPEATTDFVFSIVIEELGFLGASLILAGVFFLILRILLVGIKAKNAFNAMFALGVGGMLLVQVLVNVGGISGLIPSTGVTFPFLSQGGNSLLVLSVAIGIVLNIDANEKRHLILEEAKNSVADDRPLKAFQ